MYGKIYSTGNYADGLPKFEISIYFGEYEKFPFKMGQRMECYLVVGSQKYLCGVRSTKNAGSWVSPDIYGITESSKRMRLAEILMKNGFERKEKLKLVYNSVNQELVVNKAS